MRLTSTYEQVLDLFPVLAERAEQQAGTLSGGERQMLAIGRALMAEPRMLLLDEPSAGLAPVKVDQLFDALAHIKQERRCSILLAEQNVLAASEIADDCVVLEQGRVALAGRMSDIAQDPRLSEAYLGL